MTLVYAAMGVIALMGAVPCLLYLRSRAWRDLEVPGAPWLFLGLICLLALSIGRLCGVGGVWPYVVLDLLIVLCATVAAVKGGGRDGET